MPLEVTISGERRVGNVNVSYKDGQRVIVEKYQYQVVTNEVVTNRRDLLHPRVPNMPRVGITVSPSGLGVCETYELVRNEKNAKVWDLTVNFTSNPNFNNRQDNSNGSEDPKEWVPIYEVFIEPYTEEITKDINGRPIVNGAGDPYDTPVQVEYDLLRYDFYQYEPATITDIQLAQRNNTVNETKFKDFEAETCRLKVRKSAIGFYYGFRCRLVEYSLIYKSDKWLLRLPNVGQAFCDSSYKRHPYRFIESPNKVVMGPLGNQNYTLAGNSTTKHDFKATGGHLPSYGIDNGNNPNEKFAKNPVLTAAGIDKPIYFIEYRIYPRLDFNDFLR